MLPTDLCSVREKCHNCLRKTLQSFCTKGFSYFTYWAVEFKWRQWTKKRKKEKTLAVCEREMIRNTFLSLWNLLYLHQRSQIPSNYFCNLSCEKNNWDVFVSSFFISVRIFWMHESSIKSKDITFMNFSTWSWHLPLSHLFFVIKERESLCYVINSVFAISFKSQSL